MSDALATTSASPAARFSALSTTSRRLRDLAARRGISRSLSTLAKNTGGPLTSFTAIRTVLAVAASITSTSHAAAAAVAADDDIDDDDDNDDDRGR